MSQTAALTTDDAFAPALYAGFWRRVLASILDNLFIIVIVPLVFLLLSAFSANLSRVITVEAPFGLLTAERVLESKPEVQTKRHGMDVTVQEQIVERDFLGLVKYQYRVEKMKIGSLWIPNDYQRIDPETKQDINGANLDFITFVIGLLYGILMECSRYQATLGKMVLGLKVVDTRGRRLTFWRSAARNLLMFVSILTLGIGFLMAGWTRHKQALHDKLAKCYVTREADA